MLYHPDPPPYNILAARNERSHHKLLLEISMSDENGRNR
jgi:hypothetical protein